MKKEKIISLLFILLVCGGIGYGIYRSTGKVVHEVLLLEGETVRVGNLTQRKVTQQYRNHELSISGGQAYSVFLEGRFPDPSQQLHAKNNYSVKIVDSHDTVLFDDTVQIRFKNKNDEKKEGLNQLIGDLFPGKTSKKVIDLSEMAEGTKLKIHFSRIDGDTIANELFLTIRQKRG